MALHTTHDLAYWHMPKTGGMSVYRILREISPTCTVINGPRRHSPADEIPPELLKGKTLFGTARDPWSWYASLYQHASGGVEGQEKLKKWGNGDSSFEAALYGWTHPSEERVDNQFGVVWAFLEEKTPALRQKLLESRQGLYTWAFDYVYGNPIRPHILIDTSRLTEGMANLLKVPISQVEGITMQNLATHRPKSAFVDPQKKYTDEMREWVRNAERQLIGTLGFEPFWRAPTPLIWIG